MDIKKRLDILALSMGAGIDDPKVIPLINTALEASEKIESLEADNALLTAKVERLEKEKVILFNCNNNQANEICELTKFLNGVANKLKCLPDYCSPSLEDGNAHIGRNLDELTTNRGKE